MLTVLALIVSDPDIAGEARRQVARQECRLKDASEDIVVCGQRDTLNRYQVTDPSAPWTPESPVDSVARERARWNAEGDTGIGSCSAVGPGGWTGCKLKEWKKERQQKRGWYN